MIFTARLDGFSPVNLLQDHDSCQMVGEGHGAHGELEIGLFLDFGRHAEGRADEEAGAGLAGIFYFLQFVCEAFAGQFLALRGEDAEPSTFGKLLEDQICLFFETGRDFRRGRILRQTDFRQFQKGEFTVTAQTLFVFFGGGNIEFFFQFAHGDQGDVEHEDPSSFSKSYHKQIVNARIQ